MTEKQQIGLEILEWINKDQNYTRLLIPYALSIGAITEEQASICKAELDAYYRETGQTATHRDEVFMALMPILGFSKCKVLYQLVMQLPKYHYERTTFKAHDEEIRKSFPGMSTHVYFKIVKELIEEGYITKESGRNKVKLYTVNFPVLESKYKDSVKNREVQIENA